jgi:EAL domain-containing protein (putative c-di-GMP-specific phosphodiesterase class I)
MLAQDTFSKEDILEGLTYGQFEVYYQPVIDKSRDTLIAGEALVRWNHPRLGFLHPISFIKTAEETGAMIALGEFVLRDACLQSRKWKTEGVPFYRIAVNISMSQLHDPKFSQRVLRILSETGVPAEDVEFEITETMAMKDPDLTEQTLRELKAMGVTIYIDDFGVGYSSLSHLRRFPVDGLKMDGQFIGSALYSERDQKLMYSIILMARALDLAIVAEGVETEEQIILLKSMECHTMQGFYFTHPLSARDYFEWCKYFSENPALRV